MSLPLQPLAPHSERCRVILTEGMWRFGSHLFVMHLMLHVDAFDVSQHASRAAERAAAGA